MNYFSDEIMTKWSWIVQKNDPKIVKWAIGSQYNKVDPRVATATVFVHGTRKIYSKVYQGMSNTLTTANTALSQDNASQLTSVSLQYLVTLHNKRAYLQHRGIWWQQSSLIISDAFPLSTYNPPCPPMIPYKQRRHLRGTTNHMG